MMKNITKDELKEAVSHKLRFSFDLPKFDEEERERIVTKMADFWPDFYDRTKDVASSIVFTVFLTIFGIMKYYEESNWLISGVVYTMCGLIMFGCILMVTTDHYNKAENKDIFNMSDVARWAIEKKWTITTVVLNVAYVVVGIEMFILHHWFVATTLFLGCGTGLWIRKRHNEEIINRLGKLAKVSKEELG